MDLRSVRICFVGNMLGRNQGYVTTQGQVVADLFAGDGVQVTCVSSRINRFARLLDIIGTLIRNHRKFDILVLEVYSGMGFIVADVASFLGKLFKLPLVMVLHGGHLHAFAGRLPRWTKRVLSRADYLVAPSTFLAEKIAKLGFHVLQIPNVIDLDKYRFKTRSRISPRLIWMRSFHPIYNPEMAIDVLEKLRRCEPQATLTMAGVDKGLAEKIRRMVDERGVSDAVSFPGFLDQDEKAHEFSVADIYLNTNRIDNMPVSVIEACAFGLPVVATDVGGLRHLIEHRENGLLVPNDDATAMAEAVKELLNDADLTKRISTNARCLAEHSSWKVVREEWIELFEKIIGRSCEGDTTFVNDITSTEKAKVNPRRETNI